MELPSIYARPPPTAPTAERTRERRIDATDCLADPRQYPGSDADRSQCCLVGEEDADDGGNDDDVIFRARPLPDEDATPAAEHGRKHDRNTCPSRARIKRLLRPIAAMFSSGGAGHVTK